MEDAVDHRGYCVQCASACPMIITVSGGKLVRVRPDADHPNAADLCPKGIAMPELVSDPLRLQHPPAPHPPQGRSGSRLAAHGLGRGVGSYRRTAAGRQGRLRPGSGGLCQGVSRRIVRGGDPALGDSPVARLRHPQQCRHHPISVSGTGTSAAGTPTATVIMPNRWFPISRMPDASCYGATIRMPRAGTICSRSARGWPTGHD